MKILILTDNFPPNSQGGADRVAFNLAKGFLGKGHQVFVITVTNDKSVRQSWIDFEDLKIYKIYLPFYKERWRAYLGLYNPVAIKKLKKLIIDLRPDVVNAHNIHRYISYASLKIAKKNSRAVFLTIHDVMAFHYSKFNEFINPRVLSISDNFNYKIKPLQQVRRFKKRYNPFRNIIIRHYLNKVDKIIGVSNSIKIALEQNKIKNIEVVYNGIDLESWRINKKTLEKFKKKFNLERKKIVLFSGRLSALKGIDKLIEAIELVSKKLPNIILLVLGQKNNYSQRIKQIALKKGINLVLVGWLEKRQLKSAYWNSFLVVTPSICLDTFNMVNIEAMATKKPVVGTCFGGTREIVVDGKTGYIVNPLNIKMMSEKIIDLLENPLKAKEFGEAGYQRIKEKFTLEEQVRRYLEIFRSKV